MPIAVTRTRMAMGISTNDVDAMMVASLVREQVQAVAEYGDAAINGQQCVAQKSSTVRTHSANRTA
jgi:hypothetical protein